MRVSAIVRRLFGHSAGVAACLDASPEQARHGRRILAVLECRSSDDAVLGRALDAAAASGGFLTLVVVVPRLPSMVNAGPFCVPQPTPEELRSHAERTLRRAAARVPPETPLRTAVEESRLDEAIRRRVSVAAHDLVIVRRRRVDVRRLRRRPGAPLVVVPA